MDSLIPGAFSLEHAGILFRRSLNQYGDNDSKGILIESEGRILNVMYEAIETPLNNLARRIINHLRGGGAGTLGINKRKCLGKPSFVHKRYRLLEILLGFTGEPDDDIGRNGKARDFLACRSKKFKILLTGYSGDSSP